MRPADRQPIGQRKRHAVHRVLLIVSLIFGALMMAAAIESSPHAWLTWFALVPLFFVIRLWNSKAAALGGALWGLLVFLFSAIQPAAAITPTVQSLVLLTMLPALYAGLSAAVTRWIGFNPFILGVAWMGLELALAPTGLRGGLLGAVPAHGTVGQWIGGALGYVFVAFLVAVVSASLVSLLSNARLHLYRHPYRISSGSRPPALLAQASCGLSRQFIPSLGPRAPPISPNTLLDTGAI